jgi:hypothetical protein
MKLDLYFVGDGAEVGPHAVADRIVGALEHQAAVEAGAVALLAHGDRRDEVEGLALDGHLAGHFEAVVAQRLDRGGDELGDRERPWC